MITTEDLRIGYDEKTIVHQLNLSIQQGKITALVGANGSGKSTILKGMARLLKPQDGHVYLNGKEIFEKKTSDIAKQLSILPQNPTAPEGLTVAELVAYGRFPYQKGMGSLSKQDKEMITWAVDITGMRQFANRAVDHLSGGQRQKAWIAMALAQDTDVMFLDEPTTFLDMAHQLEVLQLLEKLNREENRTIVMVIHDLNHASRYAEEIIAIKKGEMLHSGSPSKVMTPDILETVFGVKCDIIQDARTGKPYCIPYGLQTESLMKESASFA